MTTNKYFSLSRFGNMLKNDILMNHKQYLLTIAGGSLVLLIILVWAMVARTYDYRLNDYSPIFVMFLLASAVFIGSSFPDLSSRKSTCNYLLLPSSILEKYLVQCLLRLIIFIPLALSLFIIITYLSKAIATQINIIQGSFFQIENFDLIKLVNGNNDFLNSLFMWLAIFSLATFFFSARLFFKRFALVKTVFLGAGLIFLFLCGMVLMSHIFYPETEGFNIKLNDIIIIERFNLSNVMLYVFYIAGLSWIFFLVFGYYKLKEKQE